MDVTELANAIQRSYEECIRALVAAGMGEKSAEVVAGNLIRDGLAEAARNAWGEAEAMEEES